ncbi:MAG: hypothetical protein JWM98_2823 [Thermoleophilia bacterium]|nr:hypothetical protein [Thermoleophilia bacterium]
MGTTTANSAAPTTTISLDRFRRRARAAQVAGSVAPAATHPLVGTALGVLERRYGLMSSEERVVVTEVIATSGDLAVADRLAFVAAMERHEPIVVVEFEGWYLACRTERTLDPSQLSQLRAAGDGAPRIMSIASDRGITPALGPLVA